MRNWYAFDRRRADQPTEADRALVRAWTHERDVRAPGAEEFQAGVRVVGVRPPELSAEELRDRYFYVPRANLMGRGPGWELVRR